MRPSITLLAQLPTSVPSQSKKQPSRSEVEWDKNCQNILDCRMKDGFIPTAPVHVNIETYSPSPAVREQAEGVVGGSLAKIFDLSSVHFFDSAYIQAAFYEARFAFKSKDICQAGSCLGLNGERSVLVAHVFRVIDECENVFPGPIRVAVSTSR